MAPTKTLRPLLLHSSTPLRQPLSTQLSPPRTHPQRRAFLLASPSTQTITASRTVAYPSAPIYSIIADVPSYSSFLPYCQRSDITRWSAPDKTCQRRWPSEAILTTGFGGMTESFVSRVYCVPEKGVVESIGGDAETNLSREEIAHHLESEGGDGEVQRGEGRGRSGAGSLLAYLRSKWTVESVAKDRTNVSLVVQFAFTNPFFGPLSGAAAPKVAEHMVKAFEQRIQTLLETSPDMIDATLAELDGSRMKNAK